MRPLKVSFKSPIRWKSEDARCGPCGVLSRAPTGISRRVSSVLAGEWGRALSCNKVTPCDSLPLGFSQSTVLVSQYLTRVAAVLPSCKFKDRTLGVPERCKHNLPSWWLCFGFVWWKCCWMLSLHYQVFPLRVIMLDPSSPVVMTCLKIVCLHYDAAL
jgi:hypothetical protein